MRALVTGGAGFIGSHVVEALLARGDEVHVLDNLASGKRENVPDGATLHEADIRSDVERVFDDVRPEACFHLAAQADVRVSVERPDYDADVNVLGTIRVLEAARRHGTKLVFSSTGGAIYGECDGPASEDHPRSPLAPYGTSKLAGEEYLQTYNRLYETTHVVLRYGNVFGPRQDPHGEAGVVAIFMSRLLAGEEYLQTYNRLYETTHVVLRYGNVFGPRQDPHGEAGVVAIFMSRLRDGERPRIFGDGTQTRDYVFVGDIVAATLAAPAHEGGVFNVGTGSETSVLDLYERIQRVAGIEREPEFADPRPGE